MAKKVTLDTLDIEDTSVSIREEPEPVKERDDKLPVRRFASIWFRIFCIAIVILSCVSIFSYVWMSSKKQIPPDSISKVVIPAPLEGNKNIESVNDLLIPLSVDKGRKRIMMLDLTFELNMGQQDRFMENMVRVRSSIYQTVNKKMDKVVLGPRSMNILKDEIMAELEKYLGKNVIKNIYFTRYIVL